jgi:hypothetical protein
MRQPDGLRHWKEEVDGKYFHLFDISSHQLHLLFDITVEVIPQHQVVALHQMVVNVDLRIIITMKGCHW